MAFACALYPRDDDFLGSVSAEVRYNVGRLAHHPSIVVWGGSNENEYAMSWYNYSIENRDLYLADYVKLYIDTIRPAIAAADAEGRPFVDSSPSSGLLTAEPYVKRYILYAFQYTIAHR